MRAAKVSGWVREKWRRRGWEKGGGEGGVVVGDGEGGKEETGREEGSGGGGVREERIQFNKGSSEMQRSPTHFHQEPRERTE